MLKLTSLTDYFIICSSESDPKTKAIKNHIIDNIKKNFKLKPLNIEGYEGLRWVLLDWLTLL